MKFGTILIRRGGSCYDFLDDILCARRWVSM